MSKTVRRSLALLVVVALLLALWGCADRKQGDNGNGEDTAGEPTERSPVSLVVEVEGEGETRPAAGSHSYLHLEQVALEALPAEGWEFSHWEEEPVGQLESTESGQTSITLADSCTVLAVFVLREAAEPETPASPEPEEPAVLTVEVQGQGTVDPAVGRHEYERGTSVTLQATPEPGWGFVQWQVPGRPDDSRATTTLIMDASRQITAVFAAATGETQDPPPPEDDYYHAGAQASWTMAGGGVSADYRVWNCDGLEGVWRWEGTVVFAGMGTITGSASWVMPPRPEAGPWVSAPFSYEFSGVIIPPEAPAVTLRVTNTNCVVEILQDSAADPAAMIWTSTQTNVITSTIFSSTQTYSDSHTFDLQQGCR